MSAKYIGAAIAVEVGPPEAALRDPRVIEAYLGRGIARRRRTGALR